MLWRAFILGGAVLLCGCPSTSSAPSAPAGAAHHERTDPRRAPDFTWDSAVGWERRFEFPPGVTSHHRELGRDYFDLEYVPWDDPELVVQMLSALPELESMSLLLPSKRLCEPALRDSLARAAPSRLLVHLGGDPSAAEWDCLASLAPPELYLGLCPDDGTTIWRCDGDAQLDALAQRPNLRERVRGLAVGFSDARHWSSLATYPRLSMLTVRGPVVRLPLDPAVQHALCALPDLAYVDLFDASEPGSSPQLPVECALGLETYEAWQLLDGDREWGMPATPVPESVPCRLRRVLLWSADEPTRAVLSRCENLKLEVIR